MLIWPDWTMYSCNSILYSQEQQTMCTHRKISICIDIRVHYFHTNKNISSFSLVYKHIRILSMSLIFNCNWNNLDQIVLYYIWHCSKSKGKCFFLPYTLNNVANSFEFIIRINGMTNRHSSYSGESCWQHFYILIIRLNSGLLNIELSSNDALSPSSLLLGSHLSWTC